MGVGAGAGGLSGRPCANAYCATHHNEHKRSHANSDRRSDAHSYVPPGPYNRDCNRRAIAHSDSYVTCNTDGYAFRSDVGAGATYRRSSPG